MDASSIFTPSRCVTKKHNETFAEEIGKQECSIMFVKSFIFKLTFSRVFRCFQWNPMFMISHTFFIIYVCVLLDWTSFTLSSCSSGWQITNKVRSVWTSQIALINKIYSVWIELSGVAFSGSFALLKKHGKSEMTHLSPLLFQGCLHPDKLMEKFSNPFLKYFYKCFFSLN